MLLLANFVKDADFAFRAALKQNFKPVLLTLLTRMHTSKTDKFVYLFSNFILYCMAIPVDGLTPDFTIGTVEEIQSGYVICNLPDA